MDNNPLEGRIVTTGEGQPWYFIRNGAKYMIRSNPQEVAARIGQTPMVVNQNALQGLPESSEDIFQRSPYEGAIVTEGEGKPWYYVRDGQKFQIRSDPQAAAAALGATPRLIDKSTSSSMPESAQDVLNPGSAYETGRQLIEKTKELVQGQTKFIQDYLKDNPFAFDEALARNLAQDKFRPYYQELLTDFVEPLQTAINSSQENETRVLGELTRQRNYEVGERGLRLKDAISAVRAGFAGANLIGAGFANRAENRTRLDSNRATEDFLAGSQFQETQTRKEGQQYRGNLTDQITKKQRDIFGDGRAFDTAVAGDVQSRRATSQGQYLDRLNETIRTSVGEPVVDVSSFVKLA